MVVHSNAPGIMRDWEISKSPVVLPQARVSNGKCMTRQLIMTTCKVNVSYGERGRQKREELEFTFVDFHTGDYNVEIVGSKDNPNLVSVDLAINMIWNRIIVAIFLALAGLAFIVFGVIAMAKATAMRRAFRAFNGTVLHPVPVQVTNLTKAYGRHNAQYAYDYKGKKKKVGTALRRQTPFYLSDGGNDKMALGVTDQYGEYVILMDDALTRLDFTDVEREALRNARIAASTRQPLRKDQYHFAG